MTTWRTAMRKVLHPKPNVALIFRRRVLTAWWILLMPLTGHAVPVILVACTAVARGQSSPPLLLKLQDPSIEQRLAAIQELGRIESADAVAALILRLEQSSDPRELRAVVTALSHIGAPPESVVAALFRAVAETDSGAALEAAMLEAVGRIGPRTVPALVLGLKHPLDLRIRLLSLAALRQLGSDAAAAAPQLGVALGDKGLSLAAARTLAALGPAAAPAVDDLVAVLNRQASAELSEAAAIALGRIGPPAHPAIESLFEHARHGPLRVRAAAIVALTGINPEKERVAALVVANLEDPGIELRKAACQAAIRLGPAGAAAAPALIDQLAFDRCRTLAIQALTSIGPATVAPLLATLADTNRSDIHRAVIEVLYHIGPTADAATPALARLLDHQDRYMARDAARALGAIGPGARWGVPAIVAMMGERDDDIRTAFHMALQSIGPAGSESIRPLADLVGHQDAMVRQFAAWSLGRMGGSASVASPQLTTALTDRHHAVRIWSAWALTRMDRHDPEACVAILKPGLSDEDVSIRQASAEALGRIGPPAAAAVGSLIHTIRDTDPAVRMWTAWTLGRIGREGSGVVGPLTRALDDEDAQVRLWATRSLALLRNR